MTDTDGKARMLKYARKALAKSNARKYDGDPNFKHQIVIQSAYYGATLDDREGFAFDVTFPRSVVNELGFSSTWHCESPQESAAFLRALADEIEKAGQ